MIRGISCFICLFFLAHSFPAAAQDNGKEKAPAPEEEKAAATPKEPVTKIGKTAYRLGEIEFDSKTREIRIPAVMNMPEGGPIEYLLVHEDGKIHEGMLVTKAKPLHLNIVMKLLRYQSGDGQIFDAFLPDEEQRTRLEKPDNRPAGDAVRIVAQWKDADEENHKAVPANWILDAVTMKPMTDEPWIYTGSHVMNGAFLGDIEGSLIAIYLDQVALFNMTREGADQDTRWGANAVATPALGQKITLVLKPEKKSSQ